MKSNRIFLNNDPTEYSAKEFNGINAGTLAERIASIQNAEADTLPNELLASILNDVTEKTAKHNADHLKDFQFKSKKAEDEDVEDDTEDEDEESLEKTASRKVHFSDPSQIDAKAIRTAMAKNDTELVEAIMNVRDQVRNQYAAKLEKQQAILDEKSTKLADRKKYRLTVVSNASEAKRIASTKPVAKTTVAKKENMFKNVDELNNNAKEAFMKKASDMGWDLNYVKSFLNDSNSNADTLSDIKNVMASQLSQNTKTAALKGMIKEAKLDSENIARLKKYWKDDLGYGDQEWIDDLFTTKYDK